MPHEYQEHFVHYVDSRSILDRALNLVGVEPEDVGRSFALIAGVSYYPNMPATTRELKAAAADIAKLQEYLKTYEFFDEIVLLTGSDVNLDNLQFYLQTYFPERLRRFPKSRFLFAYSGHGMTEWPRGYLLKNSARDTKDKQNSINLNVVRVFVDEIVSTGHHVLILINACYSGAFLKRGSAFGGSRQLIARNPGAHAITAGGTGELAWHIPGAGDGSVFFEKFFAGLDGRADTSPKDGVINVFELFTYLKREVQIFTDQEQNPQLGDISRHGSKGEFFFLDRDRQVSEGVLPAWNPGTGSPFGEDAATTLSKAMSYYEARDYGLALTYFHQAAEEGYVEAMSFVGSIYLHGKGTEPDWARAAVWFQKGADAGDLEAMFALALSYAAGLGVDRDDSMAALWFEKAAETGDAMAMVFVSDYYRYGRGVPRDYDAALRWAKRAADAGSSTGMLAVGRTYDLGQGVPKRPAEALRWYRKAAFAGSDTAASIIEESDYDRIAQDLLGQFKRENRVEVQLSDSQLASLDVILKQHGPYWGQVYLGLASVGVGLVPRDTEESRKRALSVLDVAAQVWAGRNLSSRARGKSAIDRLEDLASLLLAGSSEGPLYDDAVSSMRQQMLNRPELYLLDEFPADGPRLPPLY